MASGTDRLYRGLLAYARFFSKGWGPVDTYERLLDHRSVLFSREGCADILRRHPQRVSVRKVKHLKEGAVYEGEFFSPLAAYLPGLLPKQAEVARFELILPQSWPEADKKPVYIHLAGTGDHYFWRRRLMTVLPTLRSSGIGAVSLENPLYGSRKPPEQTRSQVQYVSDLFVMGMALILECMVIMHWLEGKGLGPVGLTGFSMGGHNCSLAAALWPKAVAVVPCLSWSTASSSFTEGLLAGTVCWDVLEAQLADSGRDERRGECFRRIRELETAAHSKSTPPSTSKETSGELSREIASGLGRGVTSELNWEATADIQREATRPQRKLWGLNSALKAATGGDRALSYSTEDKRERQMSLLREPVMTASFHGISSLLHLAQQSLTGRRQRVRKETREPARSKGRCHRPGSELVETMRMVLDSWTHHQNFPLPLAPGLAHFVAAREDAYIPRRQLTDVRCLWQGCKVDYVSGGHISTTLMKQNVVHQVLKQTMQRASNHQFT